MVHIQPKLVLIRAIKFRVVTSKARVAIYHFEARAMRFIAVYVLSTLCVSPLNKTGQKNWCNFDVF